MGDDRIPACFEQAGSQCVNSSVKSFPAAVLPGYVMKLSFFSAIIVAVWLSHAPGCADMPEMNFLTRFEAMETGSK